MSWRVLWACCCFLLTTSVSADDGHADPAMHVAVVANGQPIILKLELHISGRSFREVWAQGVAQRFAELDENANGLLSRDELSGHGHTAIAAATQAALAHARAPADDAVPLDAVYEQMRRLQLGAIRVSGDPSTGKLISIAPQTTTQPGSRLLRLLDSNDNQSLSEDELRAAIASATREDLDQDGLVSVDELLSTTSPFGFQNSPTNLQINTPFTCLETVVSQSALVDDCLRAGQVKSRTLISREESAVPVALFAAFDADHDDNWDHDEIREYFHSPIPNATVQISTSLVDSESTTSESTTEKVSAISDDERIVVRQPQATGVDLFWGEFQIQVGIDRQGPQRLLDAMLLAFNQSDADANQYVTPEEISEQPFWRANFDAFDGDHDDKLYEDELRAEFEKRVAEAGGGVQIHIRDLGNDLFGILDGDRSGALSRRELGRLERVTQVWDRNSDGSIQRFEIPHLYRLTVGPVIPTLPAMSELSNDMLIEQEHRATVGPVWFQAMDVNGDGDLTPAEFLGTPRQFLQMDTDRDQLLDAREAQAFRKQ